MNFYKVRINASLALSSPSKREYYGLYWQPIWNGLVEVLNGAQHIEDFKEYKHRDMLVEQVSNFKYRKVFEMPHFKSSLLNKTSY